MSAEHEGFIRQRRNLMVVSLVLLFSEVSGLTIEKLSVFGNELLIDKPMAINAALWVAGVYWLWRFYQYSAPAFKGAIRATVDSRLEQICSPVALRLLVRSKPNLSSRIADIPTDPIVSIEKRTYYVQHPDHVDIRLDLQKSASSEKAAATQGLGEQRIRIDGLLLYWLRLRAWGYMIVHTKQFTDLILPYILFALPVAYAAYVRIMPFLVSLTHTT